MAAIPCGGSASASGRETPNCYLEGTSAVAYGSCSLPIRRQSMATAQQRAILPDQAVSPLACVDAAEILYFSTVLIRFSPSGIRRPISLSEIRQTSCEMLHTRFPTTRVRLEPPRGG